MTPKSRGVCVLVAILAWPHLALAVVVSLDLEAHRVRATKRFHGVDLNGVAILGSNVPNSDNVQDVIRQCSGSLISSRHVLTAAHCVDEDQNGSVDPWITGFPFVAGFETPTGDTVIEVDLSKVHFHPTWPESFVDLAVIELIEPAPPSIPKYSVYAGTSELSRPMIVTGYGAIGTGESGENQSDDSTNSVKLAGFNRVDAIRDDLDVPFLAIDFDNGDPQQNSLAQIGFESDLGFAEHEAMIASGDSGGPALINGVIAGVASFGSQIGIHDVTDLLDGSWGEFAFYTRTSFLHEFITTATDGSAKLTDEFPLLSGDVNNDGLLDIRDLDRLAKEIRGQGTAKVYDLTKDGSVDSSDLTYCVEVAFDTFLGDANLDGQVTATDLNSLALNWSETDVMSWSQGDFTGDGIVNASDLNSLALNWQSGVATAASPATVPEPSSITLSLVGLCAIARRRKQ